MSEQLRRTTKEMKMIGLLLSCSELHRKKIAPRKTCPGRRLQDQMFEVQRRMSGQPRAKLGPCQVE